MVVQKIYFITGNQTKVLHAKVALEGLGVEVVSKKLDIIEPREEEPENIVIEKALQAFEVLKLPLMVEDSGIFIEALNGFPKTYVNFVMNTLGVENILKLLKGVNNRKVEFHQSLAYIEPGMDTPKVFSYVDGGFRIAENIWEPEDSDGVFEFDKILIPPGETKALSMFDKKWRAERDALQNEGKIHYQQLAKWLGERVSSKEK